MGTRSPAPLVPPASPCLTAAGPAASRWSSPCGSKTSPVPGSPGSARGRSVQPGDRDGDPGHAAAAAPHCCPPGPRRPTWYRKLSLWKASRSFTGPAMNVGPSSGCPAPGTCKACWELQFRARGPTEALVRYLTTPPALCVLPREAALVWYSLSIY